MFCGFWNINSYVNIELDELFNTDLKQGFSLFFEGKNLFNADVWLPNWRGTKGETFPSNPGIELMAGIKVTF